MANVNDILAHRGGVSKHSLIELFKNIENFDEMINCCAESPYIDMENATAYISRFKNNFTILDINSQSLNAKFDNLIIFLNELASSDTYFSVICIQETWITQDIATIPHLQIPHYNVISFPATCSKHSGLAVYIHESFQYKFADIEIVPSSFEQLCLDISGGGLRNKLRLCNVYRPPRDRNCELKSFLNEFTPFLSSVSNRSKNCVIVGDFNIDLLKLESRSLFAEYFELLYSFSFKPTVTLPTRLSRKSATLIDHVFCNMSVSMNAGIILSSMSDHLLPFLCLDIKQDFIKPPSTITFQPSDARSVSMFVNSINNTDFMSLLPTELSTDPNHSYEIFKSTLQESLNKYLPVKKVKYKKHKHKLRPWISQGLIRSIKVRDKMYRNMKLLDPNSTDYASAKINIQTFNRILRKSIRESKFSYYSDMFLKHKDDSRKSWKLINSLINTSHDKRNISKCFIVNGINITNESEIAENFNNYFANIGSVQASTIPNCNTGSFSQYLTSPATCRFEFTYITPEEVGQILSKFKSKNSSGYDNLSLKIIKLIAPKLSVPLSVIVNQSLYCGEFPESLKLARVIPLYKKDDASFFNNYRPISLLPAISKVYEKVVHKQLLTYMISNKLLYSHQYGFRPMHSTETAVIELVNQLLHMLDDDKVPCCIFMDLSKAFDTLDHKILLSKLSYYGLSQTPLSWFNSYLSNRIQYVDYNGHNSNKKLVNIGVPQGSILGPLLFLIYVNDMYTSSSVFNFILYADDTTLTSTFCAFDRSDSTISEELKRVYDWLCVNKLSLNINKTKYMLFHSPRRSPDSISTRITINNNPLERVNEFNFLGTTLSSNLSWKPHSSFICKKLSRTVGTLKRLKNMVPSHVLLSIYNSLFVPYMTQSTLVCGHKPMRIFKLQKRAIRIIFNKPYNAHTDVLFKKNNILKFEDIYKTSSLKFYHKYVNDSLPSYFDGMFHTDPITHQYDLRVSQPRLQMTKKMFTSQCIRYSIPKLLSTVPHNISSKFETHSFKGFSKYIKQHYISKYKDVCDIPNCYTCRNTLS